MFSAQSQSSLSSSAVAHGDHAESTPSHAETLSQTRTVTGVDVRTLPAGTEVAVETSNSRYRLVMVSDHGSRALVQGGRHVGDEREARIQGSTLRGSLLRLGWIGVGLSMELSIQGRLLDTSRVRSITISVAQ
jgi:hypothetical protein